MVVMDLRDDDGVADNQLERGRSRPHRRLQTTA